jgi:hypothetical protein
MAPDVPIRPCPLVIDLLAHRRSVATSNFGTGLAPDSRPAMRSSLLLLCSQSLTNFNRAFNHGGYILRA